MECNCPHCGHKNIAKNGQLRRCDDCKKAYAHGSRRPQPTPTAALLETVHDKPQRARMRSVRSTKSSTKSFSLKPYIFRYLLPFVVVASIGILTYSVKDTIMAQYHELLSSETTSTDEHAIIDTEVNGDSEESSADKTLATIQAYTRVYNANEQDFLVLMELMKVEGEHCKQMIVTSADSTCISKYMQYFDDNSDFMQTHSAIETLFRNHQTPYSTFDAKMHVTLEKENYDLYNFFRAYQQQNTR